MTNPDEDAHSENTSSAAGSPDKASPEASLPVAGEEPSGFHSKGEKANNKVEKSEPFIGESHTNAIVNKTESSTALSVESTNDIGTSAATSKTNGDIESPASLSPSDDSNDIMKQKTSIKSTKQKTSTKSTNKRKNSEKLNDNEIDMAHNVSDLPDLDSYLPEFGFKVPLDHIYPKKWNPYFKVRPAQAWPFIPMSFRYMKFYIQMKARKKKPFIDQLLMETSKRMYGVPLGGIGSGTIGRGFRGEFCRFQMTPGMYDYNTVSADQFIVRIADEDDTLLYQKVLAPAGRGKCRGLQSWDWDCSGLVGRYCGLYPRSWTVYDIRQHRIRLIVRQISPVIAHDYKDSCLPVGVFEWTIENHNPTPRRVSIAFTFKNGTGISQDRKGVCRSEVVKRPDCCSVLLRHQHRGASLTYCLAAAHAEGVSSSLCRGFDPNSNGADIWTTLATTGHLQEQIPAHDADAAANTAAGQSLDADTAFGPNSAETVATATAGSTPDTTDTAVGPTATASSTHTATSSSTAAAASSATGVEGEMAVGVCSQVVVPPNSNKKFQLALSWDMPHITFRSSEHTYKRRYTRWFNGETAAADIAQHSFRNFKRWETSIRDWQDTVLDEKELPAWFKSALFNQLYYVADGGTVWIDLPEKELSQLPKQDPRLEYGRFAYLESHEYRMYNTYDVHFYASWALAMLWPQLQRSLQYDMAEYTVSEDAEAYLFLFNGRKGVRKLPNTVPHDVGDPEDEPFVRLNAYCNHDVSNWKDLNPKFVLQVYRDYKLFGNDRSYLEKMWPVCLKVMEVSKTFDRDGDGLIENEGYPDQTFDSWTMHGPSAYCSSLWVASLCCMEEMASDMSDEQQQQQYQQLLSKAQLAHTDKLWNGSYYKFDSCSDPHSNSIMADQLAGHWYLALAGNQKQVFGDSRVTTALKSIYENNVLKFCDGRMGAVNGILPSGVVDRCTIQSEEMWTGVSYAVAATMIRQGMVKEGFATAEGVYRTVHEEIGLAYEAPESLFADGHYRAIGYMRPLSIWSMWQAWCLNKGKRPSETVSNAMNPSAAELRKDLP
uniref:Non-lysosomal glucosylceramidase-like n=2 Tax=Hirondellea gigas TaxID=1518452 RepID=A0A6A7G381_9CRUS